MDPFPLRILLAYFFWLGAVLVLITLLARYG